MRSSLARGIPQSAIHVYITLYKQNITQSYQYTALIITFPPTFTTRLITIQLEIFTGHYCALQNLTHLVYKNRHKLYTVSYIIQSLTQDKKLNFSRRKFLVVWCKPVVLHIFYHMHGDDAWAISICTCVIILRNQESLKIRQLATCMEWSIFWMTFAFSLPRIRFPFSTCCCVRTNQCMIHSWMTTVSGSGSHSGWITNINDQCWGINNFIIRD